MAKIVHPDPFAVTDASAQTPDPRARIAPPVHYHRADDPDGPIAEEIEPDDRPPTGSVLWRKLKRNLLFWRATRDVIQISVFGPDSVVPGQPAPLSVYLHTPEAAESIHILSRAFHHDAELIGSGYVGREVVRRALAVHLSVVHAAVSKSMLTFVWRGQPHVLVFDLHVPWESPAGPARGVLSVGSDNVRIGKIDFRLVLLPRK